jgi:hypothetical protein
VQATMERLSNMLIVQDSAEDPAAAETQPGEFEDAD